MIPPTKKQQRTLEAIDAFTNREGRTPGYRELARELGFKYWGETFRSVRSLVERGWVTVRPHRGIESYVTFGDPRPIPTTTFTTEDGRVIKAANVEDAKALARGPVSRVFVMSGPAASHHLPGRHGR